MIIATSPFARHQRQAETKKPNKAHPVLISSRKRNQDCFTYIAMKVLVFGATGNAGKEIVNHCFADERITKVVIFTRKAVPIDIESHPKAEVVMHQDFSQYPEDMMRRLEGAEVCLW